METLHSLVGYAVSNTHKYCIVGKNGVYSIYNLEAQRDESDFMSLQDCMKHLRIDINAPHKTNIFNSKNLYKYENRAHPYFEDPYLIGDYEWYLYKLDV